MTVTTTTNKQTVTGINGETEYEFTDFSIQQARDLVVYVDSVLQSSGYTVTIYTTTVGGKVTFDSAMTGGEEILLVRIVDLTQETNLPNEGALSDETLENMFDKQTMMVQQLAEQASRAITTPITSDVVATLPDPAPLEVIRWNEDGDGLENVSIEDAVADSELVSGSGSSTDHGVAVWSGTDGKTLTSTGVGTAGHILTSNGAGVDPTFQAPPVGGDVNGPGSSTDAGVAIWDGTDGTLLASTTAGTSGQVLTSNGPGVAPTFQAPSTGGDVSGPGSSVAHTLATYGDTSGNLIAAEVAIGSSGQYLKSNGAGAAPAFADLPSNLVAGPSSANDNAIAVFDGTTGKLLQDVIALGSAGQVLTSNGAGSPPSFETASIGAYGYQTAAPGFAIPSFAAAGRYFAAHGLSYTPKNLSLRLRCGFPKYLTTPGVTRGATTVITSVGHGLGVGDYVTFSDVGGTTELNGNTYYVSAVTATTFTIQSLTKTAINSSGWGAWTSGGYAEPSQYGYAPGDIITPEATYQMGSSQGYIAMESDASNVYLTIAYIASPTFFAAPAKPATRNVSVTGVTIANDQIVIPTGHGIVAGDKIYVTGIVGTTQLNDRWFIVKAVAATTLTLYDLSGADVDFATYTTYVSGGTITVYPKVAKQVLRNSVWGLLLCAS